MIQPFLLNMSMVPFTPAPKAIPPIKAILRLFPTILLTTRAIFGATWTGGLVVADITRAREILFRRSKPLSLTKPGCRQDFNYTRRSLFNPATACAGVIARPSARAEIKVFSPNVSRTAPIASL